ncbi:unnamed protein product [Dicrocoelium dendriticum]|nr:unnamed protein product [Dicrocoelium dendriticum]
MTARLFKRHGLTVAHKPTATLRRTLSNPKARPETHERRNVVYKIRCQDCDKNYVGQTGRRLSTRIQEHKRACKNHYALSLISIHTDEEGHHFDWNNTEVLAKGETRKGREFLEAWYSTQHSINMHIEIDPVYQTLRRRELKHLKKRRNRRGRLNEPSTTHQQQPGQNHPTDRPYLSELGGPVKVTGTDRGQFKSHLLIDHKSTNKSAD